jgi:thiol-disulfide isomerase/thioredoxin
MMLAIAERLAPHYLKSKEANDRDLGREFQATARLLSLPGTPMLLEGVLSSGEAFDTETLKGKVVLVQFWTPSCVHCRAEMPLLADLREEYAKKGFEVIGVCTQGGAKIVQDFIKRTTFPDGRRITWPIIVDELAPKAQQIQLAEYYNIVETPVLVLIGRDSNVVRVNPLPSALTLEVEQALYPKTAEETQE